MPKYNIIDNLHSYFDEDLPEDERKGYRYPITPWVGHHTNKTDPSVKMPDVGENEVFADPRRVTFPTTFHFLNPVDGKYVIV